MLFLLSQSTGEIVTIYYLNVNCNKIIFIIKNFNRYTKVECSVVDPQKTIESHYCFIKNYSRNLSTFSLGIYTIKPLENFMVG